MEPKVEEKVNNRNTLGAYENYRLTRWLDDNREELSRLPPAELAAKATKHLKHTVTEGNLMRGWQGVGITYPRPEDITMDLEKRMDSLEVQIVHMARSMHELLTHVTAPAMTKAPSPLNGASDHGQPRSTEGPFPG